MTTYRSREEWIINYLTYLVKRQKLIIQNEGGQATEIT